MKVTTESIATREVELTIEPDTQTIDKAMHKAARQLSRRRPIRGFRPGKAPYGMVERVFGWEAILNVALDAIAPELYQEAVKEAEIEPLGNGDLDIESQDPLVLKVKVSLAPVVTLGDYKSLHIDPEPEVALTDEQVDEQIELVRKQHAEAVPVERAVQLDDQVVAAVKGISEGETVVDQERVTLDVNDELSPPGFAEALIGIKADETREFSLTYPEDFDNEDLAGENVDFSVTVKIVHEVDLPEINDDLAKIAGDYETLTELRDALAENLRQRLELEARQKEAMAAVEALVEQGEVEYPAVMLENEMDAAMEQRKSRVQQMGFTFDAYLRMMERTEEEMREEIAADVERSLIQRLVILEFARAEGLEIEGAEMSNELTRLSSNWTATYGSERAAEMMQSLGNRSVLTSFHADMLTRKATTYLTDMLTGRAEKDEQTEDEDTNDGVEDKPEDAAAADAEEPAEAEAVESDNDETEVDKVDAES